MVILTQGQISATGDVSNVYIRLKYVYRPILTDAEVHPLISQSLPDPLIQHLRNIIAILLHKLQVAIPMQSNFPQL